MTTVLVSATYMQPHLRRFMPVFERLGITLIVPEVFERLEEEDLLPYAGQFDGVICGDDRFSARVLQASLPRLKAISKWGTGIDSIDSEAAARLGISVYRTPNAFTLPVSDTVLGYILTFARRLPWMDDQMKAGNWEKIPGRALHECTLGVVGVGNIGKMVLRKAQAFGMRLLGNDIVEIDPAFVRETGVQMLPLPELLAQSDFISLNCDLNPTSRHLMNEETFSMVKSGAVLVNTSRGPVVDEAAMVRALQYGQISGAGLDVFEFEPLPAESPLRAMDQVLLAPHNSNSSPFAWEHVHRNTLKNLLEGLGFTTSQIQEAMESLR
jgi:D-3-phosphoglycerate dehydrogenase